MIKTVLIVEGTCCGWQYLDGCCTDTAYVASLYMQCLIHKFMLYAFDLGYNAVETTKNICCAKDKSTINHSTVTGQFKKFCSGCKKH